MSLKNSDQEKQHSGKKGHTFIVLTLFSRYPTAFVQKNTIHFSFSLSGKVVLMIDVSVKRFFFVVVTFIVSSCSKEPSDYLEKGVKDFESGNYGSAITNLRRARYMMPDSFKVNLYLGKCFSKSTKQKDSEYKARYYLSAAKELAKTDDERFGVGLSLIGIYQKQKKYSRINKECKYLVEQNKKLLDSKKTYELYTMLADSHFNMEEFNEAAEYYQCIIDQYPEGLSKNQESMAKAYIQCGAAVINADKDMVPDGISFVNKAEQIEKDENNNFSNDYKLSAAKCYVIIGDYFQKEKKYKESMQYYPKAKNYYKYLNDSEKEDDVSGKIEKSTVKIDKRCEDYECLMRKGERALSKKDYDDAADYFKKAEQKGKANNEKAKAISKSGIAYFLDGEEEDALSQFKTLKEKYGEEYNKSADKDLIDLFMGSALILTSQKPGSLGKLFGKVSGIFSDGTDKEKEAIETFKGNIESGIKLMELPMNSINEKTPKNFISVVGKQCERVGDKFEDWAMKEDAKKFYERAKGYYGKLFEREKVVALTKKIRGL